ncbi:MAG: hypothetical protein ACLVGS_07670 [Streptococcus agalactiae]
MKRLSKPSRFHDALDNKFGDSGARVVIEEFLTGKSSLFALSMGTSSTSCQRLDHKRAYDGDKGPNTGGWVPMRQFLTARAWLTAVDTIVKPFLRYDCEGRPALVSFMLDLS